MLKKIEHIGIAVDSVEGLNGLFEKLLGTEVYKEEVVQEQGVNTSFLKVGESKIELLEGIDDNDDNVIKKYLQKKGPGIHHIAFEVDSIEDEVARLKQLGFIFINEEPKKGADNKKIVFIHPKSTNGILVELCEDLSPNSE
ncbi:MAG: methylmalonyl-CoA epimerase [Flavobacteriales bacterium]|nr:methylmalonyl-CoA epimerase [Flavobacteriales bacterium]